MSGFVNIYIDCMQAHEYSFVSHDTIRPWGNDGMWYVYVHVVLFRSYRSKIVLGNGCL